jgi:hypothetical protein
MLGHIKLQQFDILGILEHLMEANVIRKCYINSLKIVVSTWFEIFYHT